MRQVLQRMLTLHATLVLDVPVAAVCVAPVFAAYTAPALVVKFTAPSAAVCAAPALAVEHIAPELPVFRCMVKQRL